jgi:hypothetical protein
LKAAGCLSEGHPATLENFEGRIVEHLKQMSKKAQEGKIDVVARKKAEELH